MDTNNLSILGVLIFLIVFSNYKKIMYSLVPVKTENFIFYLKDLPDKQEAAELMNELAKKSSKLIGDLYEKYPNSEMINRIKKNYSGNNISEGLNENGLTSYTINKGEEMVMCLRDKQTLKLHNPNILMFVSIHELAHIGTKSEGHTDEFKTNFKFLLKEAVLLGAYDNQNFKNKPQDYCGIRIFSDGGL